MHSFFLNVDEHHIIGDTIGPAEPHILFIHGAGSGDRR